MFGTRAGETGCRIDEHGILILFVERIGYGRSVRIAPQVGQAKAVEVNRFGRIVENLPVPVVEERFAGCRFRTVRIDLADHQAALDCPIQRYFVRFGRILVGEQVDRQRQAAQHDLILQIVTQSRGQFLELGGCQRF